MTLAFHALPAWTMLAIFLAGGIALGSFYFQTLAWSMRRFGVDGRVSTVLALMAGRLAGLAGALFLASLVGAMPLLTMAFGILVARFAIMRRTQATAP